MNETDKKQGKSDEVEEMIADLESRGIVKESITAWLNPVVLVEKKLVG